MRRNPAALIIGTLIFIVSCASKPPVDLGIHNPESSPEADLITLHINGYCKVDQIDNYKVDSLPSNPDDKIIKLSPGVHTFFTKFIGASGYHSEHSLPVTAQFEKGNMYYLDYELEMDKSGRKVLFHIYLENNGKTGKEVTGKPLENLIAILASYSVNVESPVSQGKSAKLENKKYTLVYMPEGIYTQTDKESGITVKGKYVYTNPNYYASLMGDGFSGKVYLFDADAETIKRGNMGKIDINSEIANTILVIINSTEKEIVYRYEKPDGLKGTYITFNVVKSR